MGREGALSLLVWFSCVLAFFLCFFPYLRPHFIWLKCYDLCATRGHLEISRLKLRANEYLVTISWPADGLPKIRVCISRITYATSGSSADERLRTETCATAMRCDDLDAKGNAYITSPSCACVCACVLRLNQRLIAAKLCGFLAANHKKVAQLMMSRYGRRFHLPLIICKCR